MKKKIKKFLLISGFSFFLLKGIIWLVIIIAAFFGFKKICKGGCFAVSDLLIHPKYRNAQYPDCRIQFIGFRVCL